MPKTVSINPNNLIWAIKRAGHKLEDYLHSNPNIESWINGDKKPTIKQLEAFSKKVYVPFGYLLLPEPPTENLPIPFFRTLSGKTSTVSINVYDTVLLLQKRQTWLSEYLHENQFSEIPFIGRFQDTKNYIEIAENIRVELGMPHEWASKYSTWADALHHLVEKIETRGIITIFNGVVENNTHRPISVDDCRGFVLVDKYAPFMFINNNDSKSAQLFTIAHELAHIWVGQSAAFDFRKLEPADNPIEILCDKVAAEFLVPRESFLKIWNNNLAYVARYFKVSEIVIARRALDLGKLSKAQFYKFYDEYIHAEYEKNRGKKKGGDFYNTTKYRLSTTFASHVNNAVKTGKLLYRDAYRLTSLKGGTYQTFFSKHLY